MIWTRFTLPDGQTAEATLEPTAQGWLVRIDGATFDVPRADAAPMPGLRVLEVGRRGAAAGGAAAAARAVKAPMAGRLDRLHVQVGDEVKAGQVLFVLEAMKMQNEVRSPSAGKVQAVKAQPGAALDAGTPVLDLA
ncbi:MAG TPA: acetyl-CoA carboxylase biotin carboxyl carrier protein subunit [Candidatus Thermoplasmatota archaeon]|nr:acetyl-CoA carboxylase biotin carboxyl carrier protein subunit [Candidatus Thermoplasmatota archaeon]